MLAYGIVPGNAMPKSPIQDLIDVHELVNHIYVKLENQAERQKEVIFVSGGADADGNRLLVTRDGEATRIDNPDNLKAVMWGGPNAQNLAFADHLKTLFSYLGGGLDIMGGLSPQSKTAAQDQMLSENASAGVAAYQDTTTAHVSDVIRALCWYWWNHPEKVMHTEYALPTARDISIKRSVYPAGASDQFGRPMPLRRDVSFEEIDIRIDPYSLQYQTPQARVQMLNQIVQQTILPALPLLQQQGISLDLNNYLEKIARYMDMPDLEEIVTIAEPPPPEAQSTPEQPGMPQATTRNYVRESRSNQTQDNQHQQLLRNLQSALPGQMNGTVNR